jgi:hypothetical protein
MSRGLGQMQHNVLAFLRPAKHAYTQGEFDYIGGAGMENIKERMRHAGAKAHEQLEAQGGKSNEPDAFKAFVRLAEMHMFANLLTEDEMLVFQGGEHWTLEEGIYDLRATLRYMAITFKKIELEQRTQTAGDKFFKSGLKEDALELAKAMMGPPPGDPPHPLVNPNQYRKGSYWKIDDRFRISFYRAARSLIKRGLLIRCDDGDEQQLRFVSMRPDIERKYAEKDED